MNFKKMLTVVSIVGIVLCGIMALFAIWGDVSWDVILKTLWTFLVVLGSISVWNVVETWYAHDHPANMLREVNYTVFLLSTFGITCVLIALIRGIAWSQTMRKIISTVVVINLILIVTNIVINKANADNAISQSVQTLPPVNNVPSEVNPSVVSENISSPIS